MHPQTWRLTQKLQIPAVAEMLGISDRAVRYYESGERFPRRTTIKRYFEISDGLVTAADFYAAPESLAASATAEGQVTA